MSLLMAAVLSAWTNTAGHVVSAAPVRIVGMNVEMERREAARGKSEDGSARGKSGRGMRDEGEGKMEEVKVVTNRYPMAAFMASERTRIRRALGEYELPRRAADVREIFAADIARAEARAKAGRMTAEEFERKRKGIAAAWAHELEKPKHGLTKAEIEYWKGKL